MDDTEDRAEEEKSPRALGHIHRQTIEEVSRLFERETSLDPEEQSEITELANHLFAKAPANYLEKTSSHELFSITNTLNTYIKEFLAVDDPFKVIIQEEHGLVTVYVLVGDRPFLTNTTRESVLHIGSNIEVFLYPIVIRDGRRVSCAYLELSGLSKEQGVVLKKELERGLEHVLYATDDFTAMLVQVETLARFFESGRTSTLYTPKERKTTADFLRWLSDGGLLITGLTAWEPCPADEPCSTPETSLGIHRMTSSYGEQLHSELVEDVHDELDSDQVLTISRLRSESLIQRRSQLLTITIRERSSDRRTIRYYQLSGLLTSKALAEESSSVPYLRERLQELLDIEGAIEQSHDFKNLVNIFNSMPKEESLRLDLQDLRAVAHTILDIQNRNDTRVSVRFDRNARSASVLIVMPRDRFNSLVRNKVQGLIEEVFHSVPGSSEFFLDFSNKPHARFYFHIPIARTHLPSIDVSQLKAQIAELTRGWTDNLRERLVASDMIEDNAAIWAKYESAFADDYQALQSIEDCEHDISLIEAISTDTPIRVGMRPSEEPLPGSFVLVLCKHGGNLTISHTLPMLENAGLEVISERSFRAKPFRSEEVSIHRFLVRTKSTSFLTKEMFDQFFAPGLEEVLNERAHDDLLNSLFISANLTPRSISLLRSYCSFFWQVDKFASFSVLLGSLSTVPSAANQLWNMFEIRFNPDFHATLESRTERFQVARSMFHDSLRDVNDITKERILSGLAALIEHTTRTNFYQHSQNIALKIHSEKLEMMQTPRPKFEIFVKSPHFEGIHLRSGLIARGGLRWSDRNQDFRQEILDLVNTQNIKNALIVPSGAKGGFVLLDPPSDPSGQAAAAEIAYKDFIRSLLSVTDNRREEEVLYPDRVIVYDGEDPYLVVAADKGTATFSDLANEIAEKEFSFWLGDAFASGGSNGYDHKLYGITAKGAWESVKRHFSNIGLDYLNIPFTVLGIGDMSGDVFGNGLLQSSQAKLLAAFNHKHIFIDPNPDPHTSFQERLRLFNLPRSQWTDYNTVLLSSGGDVFERNSRAIPLSPEIRAALKIPESTSDTIDGETLISHILKAPADLLWNGGIGTYVKAKQESHSDVSDVSNDRVRINADELRAKVIGEGGNLGFTQRARIDFARRGGHINTDAIDNSGGVDLSDHEVNLKILFRDLIATNKLTLEERNTLLPEIADEIVEAVLAHNKNHAFSLTIGVRRSRKNIEYFKNLLHEVIKRNFVERKHNILPDDEELLERARKQEGLWKPELAVCLAAVKMWVSSELANSTLPSDPLLQEFLLEYFPKKIRDRFPEEILRHPLGQHIITTQVTNELIDSLGITFVHRMCRRYSTDPVTVMKCTLAADFVIGGREIRAATRSLDTHERSKQFLSLRQELNEALRDLTAWFISYYSHATLQEIIEQYQDGLQQLLTEGENVLAPSQREFFLLRRQKFSQFGLDTKTSVAYASFPNLIFFLEILWASSSSDFEILTVAPKYTTVLELLGADEVLAMGMNVEPKSRWESELLAGALRDVRRGISLLTQSLLEQENQFSKEKCDEFISSDAFQLVRSLVDELHDRQREVAEIAVMGRQIMTLAQKAADHLTPVESK